MPVGIDSKLPLAYDNTDKFYGLTKTLQQNYQQSIKMLLLTSPGERIMLANYGVGLKNFLFENTPESAMIERIYEQVRLFLPKISIISLDVRRGSNSLAANSYGDANKLTIKLVYSINGTGIRDAVTVVETRRS